MIARRMFNVYILLAFSVLCLNTERTIKPDASPAVGHKGHMPLMNKISGRHMLLMKFKICSMFLPLMKKALMGGRRQNWSLFSYNKIFCPPPSCMLCPRGLNFLEGGGEGQNLPLMK